jgi:general stress protein YciG
MPNRPGNDDRTSATGGADMNGSQTDARTEGATPTRARSNRGFASMDRAKQKEIASKGGRAAHAKGTAHEFDSGEARDAGRKGGVAVSRNREHMAAIGRRGGEARGHARGSQNGANGSRSVDQSSSVTSSNPSTPERQVAIDNQRDGMAARAVDKSTPSTDRRPLSGIENSPRGDEATGR